MGTHKPGTVEELSAWLKQRKEGWKVARMARKREMNAALGIGVR